MGCRLALSYPTQLFFHCRKNSRRRKRRFDQRKSASDDSCSSQSDCDSSSSDCTVPASPARCPQTLKLEYWERTDECLNRKWDWQDYVDEHYPNREARILATTLANATTVLEPNPFPYNCPRGVSHHTLWSIQDMSEVEIENYVVEWIGRHMPEATQWNYDKNESRSIDLFHVHVYIDSGLCSGKSGQGEVDPCETRDFFQEVSAKRPRTECEVQDLVNSGYDEQLDCFQAVSQ